MWQWCWLPPQYDVDQPRLVTPHLPVQPTALAIEGHNLIIATHQTNHPPVHFTAMNWSILSWNSQVNYGAHWGGRVPYATILLKMVFPWYCSTQRCKVLSQCLHKRTSHPSRESLMVGICQKGLIFFIMHLHARPFSKFDTFKQFAC